MYSTIRYECFLARRSILYSKIKHFIFCCILVVIASCATVPKSYYESGQASWYGKYFHGRKTANGETYNMSKMTAAHPSLKFGTRVKVVDVTTGRSVIVRINDRGPYAKNRIIDLSKAAARKLGIIGKGVSTVRLYLL